MEHFDSQLDNVFTRDVVVAATWRNRGVSGICFAECLCLGSTGARICLLENIYIGVQAVRVHVGLQLHRPFSMCSKRNVRQALQSVNRITWRRLVDVFLTQLVLVSGVDFGVQLSNT